RAAAASGSAPIPRRRAARHPSPSPRREEAAADPPAPPGPPPDIPSSSSPAAPPELASERCTARADPGPENRAARRAPGRRRNVPRSQTPAAGGLLARARRGSGERAADCGLAGLADGRDLAVDARLAVGLVAARDRAGAGDRVAGPDARREAHLVA